MAGLSLTLKPGERFLVGGALLENGPKRSSITIKDDDVFVLRLSDAIHPDDACTPVRRAYFAAQRILAAEVAPEAGAGALLDLLAPLADVFTGTPLDEAIVRARQSAEAGRYHGTLAALRQLFPVEDAMLAPRDSEAIAAR